MEKFESLSHVRWEGKSAVRIHRKLLNERRMNGLHFWEPDTG